jgi:hypothetical protein
MPKYKSAVFTFHSTSPEVGPLLGCPNSDHCYRGDDEYQTPPDVALVEPGEHQAENPIQRDCRHEAERQMAYLIRHPDIGGGDRVLHVFGAEKVMAALGGDAADAKWFRIRPVETVTPVGRGCPVDVRSNCGEGRSLRHAAFFPHKSAPAAST